MKKQIITLSSIMLLCAVIGFSSCGDGGEANTDEPTRVQNSTSTTAESTVEVDDDGKGIGEVEDVELTNPLNEQWVAKGQEIYDMKCAACHRLDATKVVGPGWEGVTERRKPEWIMNFITNVDVMLDKDPAAQKMLEECLTRMPNQNISIDDARALLEFMRKNDGEA